MWQKYKKIHTDYSMDNIGGIFHGLLRPRHKRNHRHLYHRRQIGKKMTVLVTNEIVVS